MALAEVQPKGSRKCGIDQIVGCVLAKDIKARYNVPSKPLSVKVRADYALKLVGKIQ